MLPLTPVSWTRSELLCLLIVGTIVLGPMGAKLAVDALHGFGIGVAKPPTRATGRIVGLKPTGEVNSGLPVFIIDYGVCGRTFSDRLSTSRHQPLKVGMPLPVTLDAVLPSGERVESLIETIELYDPQPNRAWPTHCAPART